MILWFVLTSYQSAWIQRRIWIILKITIFSRAFYISYIIVKSIVLTLHILFSLYIVFSERPYKLKAFGNLIIILKHNQNFMFKVWTLILVDWTILCINNTLLYFKESFIFCYKKKQLKCLLKVNKNRMCILPLVTNKMSPEVKTWMFLQTYLQHNSTIT